MIRYRFRAAEARAVSAAMKAADKEAQDALAQLTALGRQVMDAVEGDDARNEAGRAWVNHVLQRLMPDLM